MGLEERISQLDDKAAELVNNNQMLEAIPLLEELITLEPDNNLRLYSLAYVTLNLGDYKKTVVLLTKAIQKKPLDSVLHRMRAHSFFKMGEFDNAVKGFETTVALDPQSEEAKEGLFHSYVQLSNALIEGRKQEWVMQAMTALKKAAGMNYNYPYLNLLIGRANYLLGNFQESVNFLESAKKELGTIESSELERSKKILAYEKKYPEGVLEDQCIDAEAVKEFSRFYLNKEDYALALLYLEKLSKISPKDKDVWNNMGVAAAGLNRLEDAVAYYGKAIEINPENHVAWSNKGNDLHRLGKEEEAMKCLEKALEIDPKSADAWSLKGEVLKVLNKPEEALTCVEKSLELNSSSDSSWNLKGELIKSHDIKGSIKCYDKAIEINRRRDQTWNNKGTALYDIGEMKEAILCYEKAAEINPKSVDAWNGKGRALAELGRYNDAIPYYDRAIEIDPKKEIIWSNKGVSLRWCNRIAEAIYCYDKAIEINPSYASAWNNKGNALCVLKELEKAIQCYNKAIELDPEYLHAWGNKSSTLSELGRYDEALKSAIITNRLYTEAIKNFPDFKRDKNKAIYTLNDIFTRIHSNEKTIELIGRILTENNFYDQIAFVTAVFFQYAGDSLKAGNINNQIVEILIKDPSLKSVEGGSFIHINGSRNFVKSTHLELRAGADNLDYIIKMGDNAALSTTHRLKKEYVIEFFLSTMIDAHNVDSDEKKRIGIISPVVYLEGKTPILVKKRLNHITLKEFEKTATKEELDIEGTRAIGNLANIHVLATQEITRDNDKYFIGMSDSVGNTYHQEIFPFDYMTTLKRRFLSRVNIQDEQSNEFISKYKEAIDIKDNESFKYFIHTDANACNCLLGGIHLDWEMASIGNPLYDFVHFTSNIDFQDLDKQKLLDSYFSEMHNLGVSGKEIQKMFETYADNLEHIVICKTGSNINQKEYDRARMYAEQALQLMEERGHMRLADAFRDATKAQLG